jgi:hypothetical protein
MIGKKISLFKNNLKLKANDNKDQSFQVVSKKMLQIIKQKINEAPLQNDVVDDSSCEISGIVNASDT